MQSSDTETLPSRVDLPWRFFMIDYDRYRTGDSDEILVMKVTGKLDNETSLCFCECVESQIVDGSTKIVLDFGGLDENSSLGLGMLVRVHSWMKNLGGNVRFANIRGVAAEVFTAVGLNKLGNFYLSIDEACQAF